MGIITNISHYRAEPPSSPSYTLADLETLMRQYACDYQLSVDDELGEFLQLSRFCAWLARREKEKNNVR